jgi:hypothetical protein
MMAWTATYLAEAIYNIAVGCRSLTASGNENVFLETQDFAFPEPTAERSLYPLPRLSHTFQEKGFPFVSEIWTTTWQIRIGAIEHEYRGVLQARFFEYVPLFIQFIRGHPLLTFAGAATVPTNLAVDGVQVQGVVNAGVDNDGNQDYLWANVLIDIPYEYGFEREKHVDGQSVIIT